MGNPASSLVDRVGGERQIALLLDLRVGKEWRRRRICFPTQHHNSQIHNADDHIGKVKKTTRISKPSFPTSFFNPWGKRSGHICLNTDDQTSHVGELSTMGQADQQYEAYV